MWKMGRKMDDMDDMNCGEKENNKHKLESAHGI